MFDCQNTSCTRAIQMNLKSEIETTSTIIHIHPYRENMAQKQIPLPTIGCQAVALLLCFSDAIETVIQQMARF